MESYQMRRKKAQICAFRSMQANIAASIDLAQLGRSLLRRGFFAVEDVMEFEGNNCDVIFLAIGTRLDDNDMNSFPLFVATLKSLNPELAKKLEERANSEPSPWQSPRDNLNDVINKATHRSERSSYYDNHHFRYSRRHLASQSFTDQTVIEDTKKEWASASFKPYFSKAANSTHYSICSLDVSPRDNADMHNHSNDVIYNKQDGAAGKERKMSEQITGLSQLSGEKSGNVVPVDQPERGDDDPRKFPPYPQERLDQKKVQGVKQSLPSRECVKLLKKIRDKFSDHVTIAGDVTGFAFENRNWSDHDVVAYTYELTSHCIISARTAWMIRRCPINSDRFQLYLEVLSKLKSHDINALMIQCERNTEFIKNMLATLYV